MIKFYLRQTRKMLWFLWDPGGGGTWGRVLHVCTHFLAYFSTSLYINYYKKNYFCFQKKNALIYLHFFSLVGWSVGHKRFVKQWLDLLTYLLPTLVKVVRVETLDTVVTVGIVGTVVIEVTNIYFFTQILFLPNKYFFPLKKLK